MPPAAIIPCAPCCIGTFSSGDSYTADAAAGRARPDTLRSEPSKLRLLTFAFAGTYTVQPTQVVGASASGSCASNFPRPLLGGSPPSTYTTWTANAASAPPAACDRTSGTSSAPSPAFAGCTDLPATDALHSSALSGSTSRRNCRRLLRTWYVTEVRRRPSRVNIVVPSPASSRVTRTSTSSCSLIVSGISAVAPRYLYPSSTGCEVAPTIVAGSV